MGNIFSGVLWKKSANFNLDSPKRKSDSKNGTKRMSTKSEILVISKPINNTSENTTQFERNERKTRSLHSLPNKRPANEVPKTRQTNSCSLPPAPSEDTATNPVLKSLHEIKLRAQKFENDIENFQELDDSVEYHYIEEHLKRCIDDLDQMYDLVCKDKELKMERKEVYRISFALLNRLDKKAEKNKEKIS